MTIYTGAALADYLEAKGCPQGVSIELGAAGPMLRPAPRPMPARRPQFSTPTPAPAPVHPAPVHPADESPWIDTRLSYTQQRDVDRLFTLVDDDDDTDTIDRLASL